MESILAALALVFIGYMVGSVKIINQGSEALVERLGRYHRKLDAGLHFVIPFVDNLVVEDTTREQVLNVEPQLAITRDNVSLEADAVVYWRIIELEQTYYSIENIETALENVVLTTLRSAIGRMNLEETISSLQQINQTLLNQLDEATEAWGVKVTRVEVRNIAPAKTVLESMEVEKAAEIKKRAAISEAQGTVESIKLIAEALRSHQNPQEVLQFLVAQRYVDANYKLGQSPNSKIIFMDPKALSEAMSELISVPPNPGSGPHPGGIGDRSNGSS